MTSINQSLEEVLDEFFFGSDKPTPAAVLRACEAHPNFRKDILEFASLWCLFEASPQPTDLIENSVVSEESVSRLQSFVLNLTHDFENKQRQNSELAEANSALRNLAGAKLRRAASAAGLGASTLLLTKVIGKQITNVPNKVLEGLANHLNVAVDLLRQCLGLNLRIRYKASNRPDAPRMETWESAVRALSIADTEKERLIALQRKDDEE